MIVNHIYRWACQLPDKVAAIHNDEPVTYREFWQGIKLARQTLQIERIAAGKIAIIVIDNLLLAWQVSLALRWLGIHTIAGRAADSVASLGIRDAACVVVAAGERHNLNVPVLASGTKVVVIPSHSKSDIAGVDVASKWNSGRGYGGHILYTSGTTGRYKKLLFDAAREDMRDRERSAAMSFDGNTVFHGLNFGLWTGAGFKQPMAAWHVGGCVVFDQTDNVFDDFFKHGITKTSLLPPMCRELLDAARRSGGAAPRSDFEINWMSGFLSLDVAEQVVREITPKIYATYSATELVRFPMQSYFKARQDLDWLTICRGSLVEIVDEHDVVCPVDTEGYIRVGLTPVDCRSYMDDSDGDAAAFRGDYFYPGDMGVQRHDGRIRILGRIADVINFHGQKVAVAPIEQRLQRHLAAEEVCLFVRLNDLGQEELLVAVQSRQPLSQARIDFVDDEFADFPSVNIYVLERFPRTETGTQKVRRLALKNQLENTRPVVRRAASDDSGQG